METVELSLVYNELSKPIVCRVADGLCTAYKINKNDLGLCRDEEELKDLKKPGIYFLFGEPKGERSVYIGQGRLRGNERGLLNRLREHTHTNDKHRWWTEAFAFCSALKEDFNDIQLNQFERRFYDLAIEAGRYKVAQNKPSSSEPTGKNKVSLEKYIREVKLLLELLGYKIFVPLAERKTATVDNNNNIFSLSRGRARMQRVDEKNLSF